MISGKAHAAAVLGHYAASRKTSRRFCRPLFSTLTIRIRVISRLRTCVPPQGCRSTIADLHRAHEPAPVGARRSWCVPVRVARRARHR